MTTPPTLTAAQRAKRWRANNREHCREYGARQRSRRREGLRSYGRAYYAANRDTIQARQIPYRRAYKPRNRDLLAKKQRQRVAANPKKELDRNRNWRAKNVAARMFYQAERRALVASIVDKKGYEAIGGFSAVRQLASLDKKQQVQVINAANESNFVRITVDRFGRLKDDDSDVSVCRDAWLSGQHQRAEEIARIICPQTWPVLIAACEIDRQYIGRLAHYARHKLP